MTFLSVEYIEGQTLSAEVDSRGRFPAEEVASIGVEVAEALGYALERDVIHRDIKPQNIMRSRSGEIKVTDFGLAKPLERGASLTREGVVVGTLAYLAPELLNGEPASFRSDVFALDCLAWLRRA